MSQPQIPSLPPVPTPAPVSSVPKKEKTPKQKLVEYLTQNGEKYPKNATLNSLVLRYEAKYPDFIASLNLPKTQVNMADTESISEFDPSLDDYPRERGRPNEVDKKEKNVQRGEPSEKKSDKRVGRASEAEEMEIGSVDDDLTLQMLERLEILEARLAELENGICAKGKKVVVYLE